MKGDLAGALGFQVGPGPEAEHWDHSAKGLNAILRALCFTVFQHTFSFTF